MDPRRQKKICWGNSKWARASLRLAAGGRPARRGRCWGTTAVLTTRLPQRQHAPHRTRALHRNLRPLPLLAETIKTLLVHDNNQRKHGRARMCELPRRLQQKTWWVLSCALVHRSRFFSAARLNYFSLPRASLWLSRERASKREQLINRTHRGSSALPLSPSLLFDTAAAGTLATEEEHTSKSKQEGATQSCINSHAE